MHLQQLEYILALNQFRHFGRAAEHCAVSQPTLSTMIQRLEEELGVKLFDRSHQPIIPTPIGKKVLDQAAIILRQAAVLGEIIKNEEESLSGAITLAILPTVAPYLLPHIVPKLDKLLPDLNITFVELMTSECLERLQSGQIDMAIMATEVTQKEITTLPLYYEEFYGYVSTSEPQYQDKSIRSSEVDASRLWLLDEGHCFRDQLLKFCQLRRHTVCKNRYVQGNLATFMHMVERGNGMTFIPELSLDTINPEHRSLVKPFAIPRPTRLVSLSARQDFARMNLRDSLASIIRSAVPSHMLKLQPGQGVV